MIKQNILDKIKKDFDVYLTILAVLSVILLDILNIVGTEIVNTAILAILALLGFTLLKSREFMDKSAKINQKLTEQIELKIFSTTRADDFFLPQREPKVSEFENAHEIKISGATLSRTIRDNLGVFEKRLKNGASLQGVIIDPESEAINQSHLRSYQVKRDDFYKNRLKPTIDLFELLRELPDAKGEVELRLIPFFPSFGLTLIDAETPDGKIYVEIYQHKSVELNPTFKLEPKKDYYWYNFFKKQFHILWESGKKVTDNSGS